MLSFLGVLVVERNHDLRRFHRRQNEPPRHQATKKELQGGSRQARTVSRELATPPSAFLVSWCLGGGGLKNWSAVFQGVICPIYFIFGLPVAQTHTLPIDIGQSMKRTIEVRKRSAMMRPGSPRRTTDPKHGGLPCPTVKACKHFSVSSASRRAEVTEKLWEERSAVPRRG